MGSDVDAAGALIDWVEALADRDPGRLARVLADEVRLRALLPAGLVELAGRDAVLGEFARWFERLDTVELSDATAGPFSDRILLHYEVTLGKGDRRWTCAQSAVATVEDGLILTLDLVCTGFRPPL